jgi:6-phosphogluconolactonase
MDMDARVFTALEELLHVMREALISHGPTPDANVRPIGGPDRFPSQQAAGKAQEAELRKFFGAAPPAVEVLMLGAGSGKPVASLFPGSPAPTENERWVVAVETPAKPRQRLALTPVLLNRGRQAFFLVAGKNKREIAGALQAEPARKPSQYPAGIIKPEGHLVWLLDKAAEG